MLRGVDITWDAAEPAAHNHLEYRRMPDEPQLTIEQENGIAIISFAATPVLDTNAIQHLGRQLYEVVEGGPQRSVVLDFTGVTFLSSQTLGVLLTLRRKADKANTKVAVTCLREELARVFAITNLDQLFEFYQTREEAVAALAAE